MPKESYFKSKVLFPYLVRRGAYYTNVHITQYMRPGVPDVLVCYRGFFVAIETKAPNYKDPYKKLRDDQIDELVAIDCADGIAIAASSIEPVAYILDAIDKRLDARGK